MTLPDRACRKLFAASPNPYLVLDRRLHIVDANQAYLDSTGRTLHDIAGRWAWDAFPTDPDTLRKSVESFERVIRTRRADTMALLRFDIARPQSEGGGFEARYWSITHTPLLDDAGEVEFVVQHPIDVTELERLRDDARLASEKQAMNLVPAQAGIFERAQSVSEINLSLQRDLDTLQAMFQQAPGFMAVMRGPNHVYELVNDSLLRLMGPRDYLGKPVRLAIPELEGQGIFELLDKVYQTGTPFVGYGVPVQFRQTPEGAIETRYLNFVYQPLTDASGKVEGIFVEGTDVTEQYLAHQELQEKMKRIQDAERQQSFQLELADCLRALTSADDIIRTASALLGSRLDAARVLFAEIDDAQDTLLVLADWCRPGIPSIAGTASSLDAFGPEMIAALRAGHDVAIEDVATDSRTQGNRAAYEHIGVRANLSIPLLRSGTLLAVLNLHQPSPYRWTQQDMQMARNMAERTWVAAEAARAQAALLVERHESEAVFNTMIEGFALIADDWTVVRMNAAGIRLLGRAASDIIGRNHWEVFPETRGTVIEKLCRSVKETGIANISEYLYTQPNGDSQWMEVRAYPEAHQHLAIFFRDITPRRAAEEELRKESRRKDEFLAMLAHELRNPMAPISAAADLLSLGRFDERLVRQTSEIIARQVGHMTSLVNDLLDVSRVTRGLITLENAFIDVKTIVTEAVEQVRPLIEHRGHRLELHLPAEPAFVAGDKKRLVQVLANLLNNAAKYTMEAGCIVVRMEMEPEQVLLHVADNGIGMTAEVKQRAFELFTQAERSSDRSQGGLGIGLALVKSLVEMHHGAVWAASEGPGKGSVFSVSLPRVARHGTGNPRVDRRELPKAADPRLSIMIVDDNIDAAHVLELLLTGLGYTVAVEHQSRLALERATQQMPDVMLLDIGLPEMDGNELARRLRQLPHGANALLIAITGYGQPQDYERALASGFDHHFVKPVEAKKLIAVLAEWEEQSRARS